MVHPRHFIASMIAENPDKPGLFSRPAVQVTLLVVALYLGMGYDTEPTYWTSMIVSYAVAAAIILIQSRRQTTAEKQPLLKTLFPKSVWLHPSTIQDFVMTILTFGITLHLLQVLLISQGSMIMPIWMALENYAITQIQTAPPIPVIVIYVIAAMAMSDLFYYVSHRLTHVIPILWEFHKVHHSAEVLTPLTVYRIHPVDLWLNQSFRNVGSGIVSGIFFYLYPSSASLLIIATAHTGMILSYFVLANLRHSHLWISFGPALEHIFISPAQHQIHHSTTPRHFNKNYGSMFSLWDWMFGSLYVTRGKEDISVGLGKARDADVYRSTWKMLVVPVMKFGRFVMGPPRKKSVEKTD